MQPNKKQSFFQRLSGSVSSSNSFDEFDDEQEPSSYDPSRSKINNAPARATPSDDSLSNEGQLPVDIQQTPGEIIIRSFVAGLRPDELNISISRDMVEIDGSRTEREQIANSDYFARELFWGSFSRTIMLPQEVDIDLCTASAKDGLLTLTLPKLDKKKQTKLRVKSG